MQISNKAGSFAILLKCLISKISIHIPTSSRRTRRICEVKSRKALNSNKRVKDSSRKMHRMRCRIFGEIAINNICINTKPHYLNTVQVNNITNFKKLMVDFRNTIMNNLNITYPEEKTIENLFFPRSKIENFVYNDRIVNYEKVYKLLEGQQYIEYDTVNTNNLKK